MLRTQSTSPTSSNEAFSSPWMEELTGLSVLTIDPARHPRLVDFYSNYLPYNTPDGFVAAIKDFLKSIDPLLMKELRKELDSIFPHHSLKLAKIPDPIYADGTLENFILCCGANYEGSPIGAFKALRFATMKLAPLLPAVAFINLRPENYNFGLNALDVFIRNVQELPFADPQKASIALATLASTQGSDGNIRLAADTILYDIRSLFSITDTTNSGIKIRWNCSTLGLTSYLKDRGVQINAEGNECLISCWNNLIERINVEPQSLNRTVLLPIIDDNRKEDSAKIETTLENIDNELLGFLN